MTSTMADGAVVGRNRTVSVTPWLRSGLLRLVSLAFARSLLGTITRSFAPVSRCVARQFVSTTLPSMPLLEHEPVADPVRPGEVERYAREDVAKGALQGKAKDDGDRARRGDQRSDRAR